MPNNAFYFDTDEGRIYPPLILYLNAHPEADSWINCSLFVVDDADLEALDAREWIYDRVVVNDLLEGVRVDGGDAVAYTCKDRYRVEPGSDPAQLALRRSFLSLLDAVLDGLDPTVRPDFLATTQDIPKHLVVDDDLDPERPDPWEAAGKDFTPEVPKATTPTDDEPHRA
jgi:hypothetical protein